jgi:hypothetical protein
MVWFLAWAQDLGRACAALGLQAPAFRSPPLLDGVDRSVGRRRPGGVFVHVRLGLRPLAAIRADMIEGVVVANALSPTSVPSAAEARTALAGALVAPPGEAAA